MNKGEFLKQIAEESGIAPEDIAGIYTDEEKGERLIFKRTQVINQLQKICPEINKSFDDVFREEFKNISSELSELMPLIYLGYKNAKEENNELLSICGDLLRNASNTVIASLQTLRSGFRLQSGILLRSVLEMSATAVHLLTKPEQLKDFLNEDFKSSKSVSIADRVIPLFGRAWGILSQKQIHINTLHTEWYPHVEFKDTNEIPAEVTLGMIGVVIMILRITAELTFIDSVDETTYWKRHEGNKFEFLPPKDDKIDWIKAKLKKE